MAQGLKCSAALDIPELDTGISASTGNSLAIGGKGHTHDVGMLSHPEQGTRGASSTTGASPVATDIPELDRAIPTPTREKSLVRAESKGKHNVSVSLEEVM